MDGCEVPVDREHLTWVARSIGGRQGLWMASLGAWIFVMEIMGVFRWAGLISLPVGVLWYFSYQRWIPAYYQKRFGFVEALEPTAKQFAYLLLALLALFLFSLFFGNSLQSLQRVVAGRAHLMISDAAHQINLLPPLLWTGMFLTSLVSRRRGIAPGFLLLGMVIFGSIALAAVWSPGYRQVWLWRVLNAGGLGLSLLAMGLYDHVRLLILLPEHRERHDD